MASESGCWRGLWLAARQRGGRQLLRQGPRKIQGGWHRPPVGGAFNPLFKKQVCTTISLCWTFRASFPSEQGALASRLGIRAVTPALTALLRCHGRGVCFHGLQVELHCTREL